MREAFRSEMQRIAEDLQSMCELAEVAVRDASTALLTGDAALAERVVAADAHLDQLQVDVDELAVDVLARQAPVATDLRVVVAALRMSATLERMGDLAEHVALIVRRRHPGPVLDAQDRERFSRMAELAVAAIRDAAQVIGERDLALAAAVEERDAQIDELMQEIYASLAAADREGGAAPERSVAQIMDLTLLGRFYERIGDHAVSLVRRVGFLVTGGTLDPRSAATDVEDF